MRFPAFFPRLFHPPVYQGRRNHKNYFEGWYYKHVDLQGKYIWSFIFGVSHSDDPHSFIQVINGKSGDTDYIRFAIEGFSYDRKRLRVSIGNNTITQNHIEMDLSGEKYSIEGQILYNKISLYPQKLLAPGIMGWYTYAPFMECYHGIVSMNHSLNGLLNINGETVDFTGGKGYIEKDWGRSMPSDWIWLQCNHFQGRDDCSIMISIARIPWLNGHFPGFLSFIMIADKIYRFATYNRSKIKYLEIEPDAVKVELNNPRYRLEVTIFRQVSGQLKAPVQGKMSRKIAESLDANLKVRLTDNKGDVIFEGKGEHAGLEIVDDVTKYIK
ncbi:MAG: tocopherol cyclase family protein [Bacteroidales bacterium]|nr:tocopherol cyclase family protein [Bacteroidales bacterium]